MDSDSVCGILLEVSEQLKNRADSLRKLEEKNQALPRFVIIFNKIHELIIINVTWLKKYYHVL